MGRNNNVGDKLTEFYKDNSLLINNTYLKHHKYILCTDISGWTTSESDQLHIMKQTMEKCNQSIKILSVKDCVTDYELLLSNIQIMFR